MNTLALIFTELRPKHWIKNFVIFLPAIFANQILSLFNLERLLVGFWIISATASSLYILNDIIDREKDKNHPDKKNRPIASGRLPLSSAYLSASLLLVSAYSLSYFLDLRLVIVLAIYTALIVLYSFYLKNIQIVDMIIIASGFILRIVFGALLVSVPVSNWIVVTTFFFALFLVSCKRRLELKILDHQAKSYRKVLGSYSPTFANLILGITATLAITSYSIYTLEGSTIAKVGTSNLIYTVPWVFIFITRLIQVSVDDDFIETSDPTNLILQDPTIFLASIGWFISILIIVLW